MCIRGLRMAEILKSGNVVKDIHSNKKVVIKEMRVILENEKLVSEKPHGDGDFSYVCGSDYCRCAQ